MIDYRLHTMTDRREVWMHGLTEKMKKTVRITNVAEQDALRRADMKAMAPSERFKALMHARDRAYEYSGLSKVYSVRKLN